MDGCIPFSGYIDRRGYGRTPRPQRAAHRVAYEAAFGPIPDGMTVDHICFNTACVNPAHLRLLTNAQNAARQRSALATHCKNGHEYTPENTYTRPRRPGEGHRDCRACIRARVRRYQQRVAA